MIFNYYKFVFLFKLIYHLAYWYCCLFIIILPLGMSLYIIQPAPITQLSPIVTPLRMITLLAIQQCLPIYYRCSCVALIFYGYIFIFIAMVMVIYFYIFSKNTPITNSYI